jgi:hypothetical protein
VLRDLADELTAIAAAGEHRIVDVGDRGHDAVDEIANHDADVVHALNRPVIAVARVGSATRPRQDTRKRLPPGRSGRSRAPR